MTVYRRLNARDDEMIGNLDEHAAYPQGHQERHDRRFGTGAQEAPRPSEEGATVMTDAASDSLGESVIDLSKVTKIVLEVEELINNLHGVDLDETNAVTSQSKSRTRTERAQVSQDLNLLSDRLLLASSLVRSEYWKARGVRDPLS
jgi:hypothetical protein